MKTALTTALSALTTALSGEAIRLEKVGESGVATSLDNIRKAVDGAFVEAVADEDQGQVLDPMRLGLDFLSGALERTIEAAAAKERRISEDERPFTPDELSALGTVMRERGIYSYVSRRGAVTMGGAPDITPLVLAMNAAARGVKAGAEG